MKHTSRLLLLLLFTLSHVFSSAQDSASVKKYRIALFTPLYLDSAFDQTSTYRYGTNFPKYINAGLEFYEGAQLAIDSLEKENISLDVQVYDSKSEGTNVTTVVQSNLLDSTDMIIGQVTATEVRMLANAAQKRNIPFINATYPNDAGITNNPDFVILNSRLVTHCTAIYKFIQKNYALSPVVFFKKKGSQEDRLLEYFNNISKTTSSVPLKITTVPLDDNFTADDLKKYLNADATTVCISGSLDVNFGQSLTQQLASVYDDNRTVVFGMPTWWDATNFAKPEFRNIEVFYTTPFYLPPTNRLVVTIQNFYRQKYFSRPTDMVFRGYETMYHFAHLLHEYGRNANTSFSDKRFNVFTDFDIQPVIDSKTTVLDFFENRKIYFIKEVGGVVTAVY